MKKSRYIIMMWVLLLFTAFTACTPFEEDKPDAGLVAPPDPAQMDFSITPDAEGFRFTLQYTKPEIKGIYQVSWDLGNGSTAKGEKVTAYYPLPDTYAVTMTILTNAGKSSVTKNILTQKTDYSIFNDPVIIAVSGGVDALEGKTWAMDSLARAHLGIGPAGSDGTTWWAASPLEKAAAQHLYDDRITFKLDGFRATYKNNGKSFVKDFRREDPAYSNAYATTGDWVVDYPNPQPGTWSVEKRGNKNYLKLAGPTPIFPLFDVGAKNGEYEILSVDNNFLDLLAIGGDGNAWRIKLIRAGYVKPQVTMDISLSPAAGINTHQVTFSNVQIPAGESITKIKVDFGDGTTEETTSYTAPVVHTYMRKGVYQVTVTAETSVGAVTKAFPVTIAENHPDYVPFLLDMMVMYNDFSEVSLAPVLGQDCDVSVVANPSRIYPNKSAFVARYSKTNNEWANAYMQLPAGYRFDLGRQHIFRLKVYGKAGDKVLLKLENTDKGGNAWQTGTYDLIYEIKKDNTWEIAEFNFAGVGAGWDWTGDQFTGDVTTDSRFSKDFYNVVRIMLNPGVGSGTHTFWFDELSGPHVEGLKSARF